MIEPTAAEAAAQEPTGLAGLRAIRQSRTGNRRSTARKAAPRKATSRADTAAKRGKYSDRIIGAIKTGCALLYGRAPVQAAIIESRAEPWALALDRVAAEDKRVDAFLSKVSGFFGKGSAWGDLAGETMVTASALMISAGVVPTGPVGMAVAFMGGAAVDAGTALAARRLAERDLDAQGVPEDHPDRKAYVDEVSAQYLAQLRAGIQEAADRHRPQPADGAATEEFPAAA